jgi:hypothetical protein
VAAALTTKRLQLLKEMSAGLQKVVMLWNKDDLGMTLRYEASAKVAEALGIHGAGRRCSRTRRFQRGFHRHGARYAGCDPDGGGLAHQPQSKAGVWFCRGQEAAGDL